MKSRIALVLIFSLVVAALLFLDFQSSNHPNSFLPETPTANSQLTNTHLNPKVENFVLFDDKSNNFELYRHAQDRAIVIISQGNGCPVGRRSYARIQELQNTFREKGVSFFYLNPNSQDSVNTIHKEISEFQIQIPILRDSAQVVGKMLQLERNATAVVIDPKTWTQIYHGPIDNRYEFGVERPGAITELLQNALHAFLSGTPLPFEKQEAKSCVINYLLESGIGDSEDETYSKHIAPMLMRNCFPCHATNGRAPWSMSDYAAVHGWAPTIREAILNRRMPPWNYDSQFGSFTNLPQLSDEEKATLIHWIDSGSHRGAGDDILQAYVPPPEKRDWALGAPDQELKYPDQDIPAAGQIIRYLSIVPDIPHDMWLSAIDVNVENVKALHHLLIYSFPSGVEPFAVDSFGDLVLLRGPRNVGAEFLPQNTGLLLRKGSSISLDLHYRATGKAETDHPRVALYFHKTPPEHAFIYTLATDMDFEIPAGAHNHSITHTLLVDREVLIQILGPHMHYRGSSARYEAVYPDGSREILLSVPKYNSDWQVPYQFEPAKVLPKGTRIICTGTYDNSSLNTRNPDSTIAVRYGSNPEDEMFKFYVGYSETDPAHGPRAQETKNPNPAGTKTTEPLTPAITQIS